MTLHIVLDSVPLGVLINPKPNPEVIAITQWMRACIAAGHPFYLPEVIDYEIRRELIRIGSKQSLAKLDALKNSLSYLPLTTDTMLTAADLWASSRNSGVSTGDPKKLDVDVILCAQAMTFEKSYDNIIVPNTMLVITSERAIIATSNVKHISRFFEADEWQNIKP